LKNGNDKKVAYATIWIFGIILSRFKILYKMNINIIPDTTATKRVENNEAPNILKKIPINRGRTKLAFPPLPTIVL
jgi:hypothetical protein